jgi:fatty-acyl-CoA synthase
VERERPVAAICDEEFADRIRAAGIRAYVAWSDGDGVAGSEVEAMIAEGDGSARKPPPEPGGLTILSSGTTGAPKGVQRESGGSLAPMLGYVERVGLRARETMVLPAPMFHGWGLFHLGIALLTGHTLVLRRRFDPEATLALIAEHRAQAAPMVPVMLLRMVELPAETRGRYDTSSLTAIPLGGSAVPGGLAGRAMDAFGEVVSNTYGSTEVAMASVATPADLRADESSAGKPLPGTKVAILAEDDGRKLPVGETGVIFVGSKLRSEGYSDGTGKEERRGMLSSGDLGHLDSAGQLFVDGREDDMIVSGGENVFPGEIEDLLTNHPAIADAAVIGVADDQFGQRVRAFVVVREGERIDADGVRAHVKENLARYKVPREVDFLDELPRNPTGKILKRELAGSE